MARSSDIRQKEVINVLDGRRMGTIIDMELSSDGRIDNITVPGPVRIMDLFRGSRNGIVISWDRVRMIGEDVILVELDPQYLRRYERS